MFARQDHLQICVIFVGQDFSVANVMSSDDSRDILMTLSKLILFAENYIGVNMSLARFYMMEADKIRKTKGLASISSAVLCPRCLLIMRPETCNISLLPNVKAKQHIQKLTRLCKRTAKQQLAPASTLIEHRCLACKHKFVDLCLNKKPPRASVKSGLKNSQEKGLTTHSVLTPKPCHTAVQSRKYVVPVGKPAKSSNQSDVNRCAMKPNSKQANSLPDTPVVRKATNQKKDLKLKHNFLQNLLRTERENRAKSSADCLRQFFSS